MKGQRLFQIIGLVDGDLVEDALRPPAKRNHSHPFLRYGVGVGAAACIGLLLLTATVGLPDGQSSKEASAGTAEPAASAPASFAPAETPQSGEEAQPFLSYAGPVLPLTTVEETPLTAERFLYLEFEQSGQARVYDRYVLTNPTDEDVDVTLLYPIVGKLGEFDRIEPRFDRWGKYTVPLAGRYAGSFQSAFGAEQADTHNLRQPSTWDDYAAAMENGDLSYALADAPVLDEVVTVYEFSDCQAPTDQYPAATLGMEFTIDTEKTQIMTYGFNGCSWDEDSGWRLYDFFVPNGQRRDTEPKLLVVRGQGIGDYTLQGYADGGCNRPISGAACTVTRSEMTLDALIDKLCWAYLEQNGDNFSGIVNTDARKLPMSLYKKCVKELLTEYGLLSDTPTDRYSSGRLDDIVTEALTLDRIFYFRVPTVTIAAGESMDVYVESTKAASFDFAGSGSDRVGMEGYDFVTTLGSSLAFTAQHLDLSYYDYSEPYSEHQVWGFDDSLLLRHNLDSYFNGDGTLDLTVQHYYLELKR